MVLFHTSSFCGSYKIIGKMSTSSGKRKIWHLSWRLRGPNRCGSWSVSTSVRRPHVSTVRQMRCIGLLDAEREGEMLGVPAAATQHHVHCTRRQRHDVYDDAGVIGCFQSKLCGFLVIPNCVHFRYTFSLLQASVFRTKCQFIRIYFTNLRQKLV